MTLINLTGMRFGRLIAIKGKRENRLTTWECLCDCGNINIVSSNSLSKGETVSCGCLKESHISNKLKKYCISMYNGIPEYTIFKNPETGYFLPFDIYIPENIFIEINGEQHYSFSKYFHRTLGEFEYRKKTDILKRNYAMENGLYIEIDLREVKTIEEAIKIVEREKSDYEKAQSKI